MKCERISIKPNPILTLCLFVIILGCSKSPKGDNHRNTSMFHDHDIYQPVINISRENAKIVSARSQYLIKNGDTDALLKGEVSADFFNEDGDHVSILYSDSARINQRTNNLRAMGNVRVVSDSGYTLSANTILWDNQYKLIESEDSVMFTTTEEDTMYGIGFESDMDLSQWKIFKPHGVSHKGF